MANKLYDDLITSAKQKAIVEKTIPAATTFNPMETDNILPGSSNGQNMTRTKQAVPMRFTRASVQPLPSNAYSATQIDQNLPVKESKPLDLGAIAQDVAKTNWGMFGEQQKVTAQNTLNGLKSLLLNAGDLLVQSQFGKIPVVGDIVNTVYDIASEPIKANVAKENRQRQTEYQQKYEGVEQSQFGKVAGDVTSGIIGMTPMIASNAIMPGTGLYTMFGQVAEEEYRNALFEGATPKQAAVYGILKGGIEVGTEKMFGGIPGMPEGAFTKGISGQITKWLSAGAGEGAEAALKSLATQEIAEKFVTKAVDILGEGAEEYISEVLSDAVKKVYDGSEQSVESYAGAIVDSLGSKESFYAAFVGSLTSGFMELGSYTAGTGMMQLAKENDISTLDTETQKELSKKIAKRSNTDIVEIPADDTRNGMFRVDPETGRKTVYIAENADQPFAIIAKHEITHSLAKEKGFSKIIEKTLNEFFDPASLQTQLTRIAAKYDAFYKTQYESGETDTLRVSTREENLEELFAQMMETEFMNSAQAIRKLAKTDYKLANKIRYQIGKFGAQLRGDQGYLYFKGVEDTYNQFLSQVEKKTAKATPTLGLTETLAKATGINQKLAPASLKTKEQASVKATPKQEYEGSKNETMKTLAANKNYGVKMENDGISIDVHTIAKQGSETMETSGNGIYYAMTKKTADGTDDAYVAKELNVTSKGKIKVKNPITIAGDSVHAAHSQLIKERIGAKNATFYQAFTHDLMRDMTAALINNSTRNRAIDMMVKVSGITKERASEAYDLIVDKNKIDSKKGRVETYNRANIMSQIEAFMGVELARSKGYDAIVVYRANKELPMIHDEYLKAQKKAADLEKELKEDYKMSPEELKETAQKYRKNKSDNAAENKLIQFYDEYLKVVGIGKSGSQLNALKEKNRVEMNKVEIAGVIDLRNVDDAKLIQDTSEAYSLKSRDSKGHYLTEEQKYYFRNSQVVDENGKLLVMYHGSPAAVTKEFVKFEYDHVGKNGSLYGVGFYHTPDADTASLYGKKLKHYINITKPLSQYAVTLDKAKLVDLVSKFYEDHKDVKVRTIDQYDRMRNYNAINPDIVHYARTVTDEFDTDIDIITGIVSVQNMSKGLIEKFYKRFTDEMGYDGYIDRARVTGEIKLTVQFSSKQSKDIENKRPTESDHFMYSLRQDNMMFYSVMRNNILGLKQNVFTVKEAIALVTKGTKAEEYKWSGLKAFLESKNGSEKVSREELLSIMNENETKVIVNVYSQTSEEDEDSEDDEMYQDEDGAFVSYDTKYQGYAFGQTNYTETVVQVTNPSIPFDYKSAHWDEANPVLHFRSSEVFSALNDKRNFLLEELQSDLHQEGATEGYFDDRESLEKYNKLKEEYNDKNKEVYNLDRHMTRIVKEKSSAMRTMIDELIKEANGNVRWRPGDQVMVEYDPNSTSNSKVIVTRDRILHLNGAKRIENRPYEDENPIDDVIEKMNKSRERLTNPYPDLLLSRQIITFKWYAKNDGKYYVDITPYADNYNDAHEFALSSMLPDLFPDIYSSETYQKTTTKNGKSLDDMQREYNRLQNEAHLLYTQMEKFDRSVKIASGDGEDDYQEYGEVVIPDNPYKGDAWAELGLRIALKQAADNGYERFFVANGFMNAARYAKPLFIDNVTFMVSRGGTLQRLYGLGVMEQKKEYDLNIHNPRARSIEDLVDVLKNADKTEAFTQDQYEELAYALQSGTAHQVSVNYDKPIVKVDRINGMRTNYDVKYLSILKKFFKKFGISMQDDVVTSREADLNINAHVENVSRAIPLHFYEMTDQEMLSLLSLREIIFKAVETQDEALLNSIYEDEGIAKLASRVNANDRLFEEVEKVRASLTGKYDAYSGLYLTQKLEYKKESLMNKNFKINGERPDQIIYDYNVNNGIERLPYFEITDEVRNFLSSGLPLYSIKEKVDGYYSVLKNNLDAKMPKSATVRDVINIAKQSKPEEYLWSGLQSYLEGKALSEKVTKEEVMEILSSESAQVYVTKYEKDNKYLNKSGRYENYTMLYRLLDSQDFNKLNYREFIYEIKSPKLGESLYMHPHWARVTNPLMHLRFHNNQSYLILEELQSDLHQAALKQGYAEFGEDPMAPEINEYKRRRLDLHQKAINRLKLNDNKNAPYRFVGIDGSKLQYGDSAEAVLKKMVDARAAFMGKAEYRDIQPPELEKVLEGGVMTYNVKVKTDTFFTKDASKDLKIVEYPMEYQMLENVQPSLEYNPFTGDSYNYEDLNTEAKRMKDALEKVAYYKGKVPLLPYSKDLYMEFGVRELLKIAAREGLSTLILPRGAEQASRYESKATYKTASMERIGSYIRLRFTMLRSGRLEKGSIMYKGESRTDKVDLEQMNKIFTPEELAEIRKAKNNYQNYDELTEIKRFDFGGGRITNPYYNGMSKFYDEKIVSYLNKIGRKYGVLVTNKMITSNLLYYGLNEDEYTDVQFKNQDGDVAGGELNNNMIVRTFEITNEMRKDILENGQIMYSIKDDSGIKDSEGNRLNQNMANWLKDTKAVDEFGDPVLMYHGSNTAGFTVFDGYYGDGNYKYTGVGSEVSFFTSNPSMASSYAKDDSLVDMGRLDSDNVEDYLNEVKKEIRNMPDLEMVPANDGSGKMTYRPKQEDKNWKHEIVVNEDNSVTVIGRYNEEIKTYDSMDEMYYNLKADVIKHYGMDTGGMYRVYLNIKKPLIVDAKERPWNEIRYKRKTVTTNEIVEMALESGNYDGVIIKNVEDNGQYGYGDIGDVYVVFKSNQIKDKDNPDPSEANDIRYSLKEEEKAELDELNELIDSVPFAIPAEWGKRRDELIKKRDSSIKFEELKAPKEFKDFKDAWNKYKDDDVYDRKWLNYALDIVKGKTINGKTKRTKEDWLMVAKMIGANAQVKTGEELTKLAIQTWVSVHPNTKETLNRQGQSFVDFKTQEWIKAMYDGAGVGQPTTLPILEENSVLSTLAEIAMDEEKIEEKKLEVKPEVQTDQVETLASFPEKKAETLFSHEFEPETDVSDDLAAVMAGRPIKRLKNPEPGPDQKTETRSHQDTVLSSGIVTEKVSNKVLGLEENGTFDYVVASDKEALEHAEEEVTKDALGSFKTFEKKVERGERLTKLDIAIAERLILHYSQDVVNSEKVMQLIADLSIVGTEMGQSIQAMKLIRKMSPQAQLITLQRASKRLEKQFLKEGNEISIKFNPELVSNLLKQKSGDTKGIEEAVDLLKQDIASQIPVKFVDKVFAWRYLSMLGNPRTHIRNMIGNAIFIPMRMSKDAIATGLEKRYPITERTHAVLTFKDKALKDFAEVNFEIAQAMVTSGGKYDIKQDILSKRRMFKTGVLDKMYNLNFDALEAEDIWAMKKAFTSTFAQYMKAKGLTPESITQKQIQEAQIHAANEAKRMTYRDASELANYLTYMERTSKSKVLRFALQSTIPFKKTPINIMKRGVEFSPIGLVDALTRQASLLKKEKITPTQFVDSLASGLTGTGIALLGAFMSSLGWINPEDDENKKKNYFDEMLGSQKFSIELPFGTYTIDWAVPAVMPLFIGALIQREVENKGKSLFDMNVAPEAMLKIFDPVFELTMLQGVTNTLQSFSSDGASFFGEAAKTAGENYAGQFIPTLAGQLARTIDATRRSTYASKDSPLNPAIETFLRRMANKVGVGQLINAPLVNQRGEDMKQSDNVLIRALMNMVSPGYYASKELTAQDKEIIKLFDLTKDLNVIPDVASKSFTENKETYVLNNEEYSAFAKTMGRTSYDGIAKLVEKKAYANATDDEKISMVDIIYKYANEKAKAEYLSPKKVAITDSLYLKIMRGESRGVSVADYAIGKMTYDTLGETRISKKTAYIYSLVNRGMNYEKVVYLLESVGGYKVTDSDKETIRNRIRASN